MAEEKYQTSIPSTYSYVPAVPFYETGSSVYGSTYHQFAEPTAPLASLMTAATIAPIDHQMEKIKKIVERFEISQDMAKKLLQLTNFDIVIICDDSGSMSSYVTTPADTNFQTAKTRWSELKSIVDTILEVTTIFDDDGVDLYFLNRGTFKNVTDHKTVQELFTPPPSGRTPICDVLRRVLSDKLVLGEKNLLIVLATDGEPTDSRGLTDGQKELLTDILMQRKPLDKIFVTALACTDDERHVGYLEKMNTLENCCFVDDYYSQKTAVFHTHSHYDYTFGAYISQILLGAICKDVGDLGKKEKKHGGCSIL